MNRTELIAAVREHAVANYEQQGWDFVVETMDDEELGKLIGRARTVKGAIAKVLATISLWEERRVEVQAMAGEDEAMVTENNYGEQGGGIPACKTGCRLTHDVAEAEAQAHLIAEKVAAGTRQAENHAHTLPAWEPITTPEGASLPSSIDELHNQVANALGNLSRYLSGEWSVGADLELGVGMIRDEAFVARLLELELKRRLDEDEKDYSPTPAVTETGVVCGNCTHRDHNDDRVIIRHATASDVRDCYAYRYHQEEQAEAELAAERRVERFFEEGF
jgi:hypothetical protein